MERLSYFAYGSNMSVPRFNKRVPSAQCKGTGFLSGHRLVFHKVGLRDGSGKCDAHETGNTEDYIAGVLYTIDRKHKDLLHSIEGVGNGYGVKHIDITTPAGTRVSAFTYYATHINPDLRPFHWYKHHVLCGARECNLPDEYIDKILSVESIEDPDEARAVRELSIYNL